MEPLMTSLPFVDSLLAMRPGQVLEMCGPSGSGKTELLTQAAASCILPKAYGGAAANALFMDLDGCFDALRLIHVLDARVRAGSRTDGAGGPLEDAPTTAVVLEESLARFHLVRCHDSFQFLAALRVARSGALGDGAGNFRLLLLDSVGAFYWLDRSLRGGAEVMDDRERVERGIAVPYSLGAVHRAVARELTELLQTQRASAIAAKATLSDSPGGGWDRDIRGAGEWSSGSGGGDPWAFREHLPKAWQDLVTHRLLLQLSPQSQRGGGGEVVRLGKWHLPEVPLVHRFAIRDGGIAVC